MPAGEDLVHNISVHLCTKTSACTVLVCLSLHGHSLYENNCLDYANFNREKPNLCKYPQLKIIRNGIKKSPFPNWHCQLLAGETHSLSGVLNCAELLHLPPFENVEQFKFPLAIHGHAPDT